MSVLDNLSPVGGSPVVPAAGSPVAPASSTSKPAAASDDTLISMLVDETEHKEKGSDKADGAAVYPDFEAPSSTSPSIFGGSGSTSTGGSDNWMLDDSVPSDSGSGAAESAEPEKVLMSLAALPVETIVDTVDITLTDLIVRGCKLEDYDGEDDDKLLTSDADRKALTKATERYLESQSIRITPLTALIFTIVLVYGKKLMFGMKLKKMIAKQEQMESELERLRSDNARLYDEIRRKTAKVADDDDITDAVWYETK